MLSLVANALAHDEPVTVMAGSGTTNPRRMFWETMELMQCMAKEPLHLTYRAVGSSTGQKEFVGPDDKGVGYHSLMQAFGAGDIPFSEDNFNALKKANRTMLHVPIAIGAIGVFHSIPEGELGDDGELNLDACTLGEIYMGAITRWDDERIVKQNPGMTAASEIFVAHRVKGSSSTSGFTEYLEQTAPTCWTLGGHKEFGKDKAQGDWPTGVGKEGSGGMSEYLESRAYAIGYIDYGHGDDAGLTAIALKNHDGKYVVPAPKGIEDAAKFAVNAGDVYPEDPTDSFQGVNLYGIKGEDTYPIVMTTYIYLAEDYTSRPADTAAATKAFVEMVISPEIGQPIAVENGFVEMPQELVSYSKAALDKVKWPEAMQPFFFETDDKTAFTKETTRKEEGMQPRFLSGKRKCYGDYERKQILEAIEEVDPDTFATSEELDDAKAQIGALQKQLDDNDGDDDQTAAFAKAGLTMTRL